MCVANIVIMANLYINLICLYTVNQCYSCITGGEDFYSGPYMVMFTAGETSVSFNVSIINDNTLEANEDFTLTIDSSSILNNFRVGDPGSAIVTIVNDDGE